MNRFALFTACAILVGLGSGCQKRNSQTSDVPGAIPLHQKASLKSKVTKLVIRTTKDGVGPGAKTGDLVYVKYTGKLGDGTVFDTNAKEGDSPLYVQLGTTSVIQGWTQGLAGIKKGEERDLDIPSKLAYGSAGQGPIPPDADLYFHVEAVDMIPASDANTVDVKDIKVGSGRAVKMGDTISVKYVGKLLDGTQFEKSDKPVEVPLGQGRALPGFEQGVIGMKVGGERELHIPPMAGYGAFGRPPRIPSNSVLIYDVTLESIK